MARRAKERSPLTPLGGGSHSPDDSVPELGTAGDEGALAHYRDPTYFRHAYRDRTQDIAYYTRLATRAGGPVLEYGVGSGRIAIPMARSGVSVTGVDLSSAMLEDLQRQLAGEPRSVQRRLRVVQGDMRSVRLRRRFKLIIAGFNTFLHLYSREDVEHFLARVRSHLASDGEFVFDYSAPRCADLALDPERWYGCPRLKHPTTGKVVNYAERFEYVPLRQLLVMKLRFTPRDGTRPQVVPLTHRQFFPQELEALLHYNGFTTQRWSGDFTGLRPTPASDTLVVHCRPEAEQKKRANPALESPPARA